jgi:hypothetical protein
MLEKPLGSGLGAAGNWSDESLAGGESAVGVVAAQTGVPGLIAYFAFYGAAVAGLLTASWRRRGPAGDVALVLAGALFGLFVVSFVSESAFGLLGNAPYFIFAGWVLAVATPASRRFRFSALPPASGDGDDWPGLADLVQIDPVHLRYTRYEGIRSSDSQLSKLCPGDRAEPTGEAASKDDRVV